MYCLINFLLEVLILDFSYGICEFQEIIKPLHY